MAATAAAQEGQARRAVAAEFLHAWHSHEASKLGSRYPALRAEYLRRAGLIDAAYESDIEPHRHAILNEKLGEHLPAFLQPVFKSYAGQLLTQQATIPAGSTAGLAPVPR